MKDVVNMKKKILSAILSLCMVLTLLPGNVLAEEGNRQEDKTVKGEIEETT